jgi:hypothetical protein
MRRNGGCCSRVERQGRRKRKVDITNMNGILKYTAAAVMTGGLTLAAVTAGNAHGWHHGGGVGAAIGFGAGALVGAAAANSAYYGDGGDYGYYYEPGYYGYGYSPAYYNYAYAGRANWYARSRSLNHGQGPGCIQSPASHEYTSCD